MTEAQEKIYLWSLISRARKVGKRIPDKWLKYGDIPNSTLEILEANLDKFVDDIKEKNIFESESLFYKMMKGKSR